MKKVVYLAGAQEGEHLRLEAERGIVVCVSHECVPGRTQNQWRDRIFFDIPADVLKCAVESLQP